MVDVFEVNRRIWNKQVSEQNKWTVPVSPEVIQRAREGAIEVVLTPIKKVPRHWFPENLVGRKILCLASGGGQQVPILAAAGAEVISFDLSDKQLEQDRLVATREGLALSTVQGNMAEPWPFENESFDLIFNPCSLCFIPDVLHVWREASRVLRKSGKLMVGITNPVSYCFDFELKNRSIFTLKYALPFSDLQSLSAEEHIRFIGEHAPLEFSHTLSDLLQGQMKHGFNLIDFYEDDWDGKDPMDKYFPGFMATLAIKMT